MRKIYMKKKTAATLTAGAICLGTAAGAYAYWTTSGSGTGSASTSSGVSNVSVSQSAAQQNLGLYPGQAPQSISGTVTNNNATGGQSAYVTSVSATISSVTPANGLTCDATNYVIAGPAAPVGQNLAAGASTSFGVGGQTIQFVDKATNQDGCKGATVNLSFTSN